MTHELKKIIREYQSATSRGIKTVLATVVALDGSSYRRPGVRMLILEDGHMVGAVSGGCVEKEVIRQAQPVFDDQTSKIMTYDGRYRLGCEGILYILLEPLRPDTILLETFEQTIQSRQHFKVRSYFEKKEGLNAYFGSTFIFGNKELPLFPGYQGKDELEVFEQNMQPCFKLFIIGAEHDAVQLCSFAALTGWEVTVIANPTEEKNILDFEGANEFLGTLPEGFPLDEVDQNTAIILMNHSYSKDLKYLLTLRHSKPIYLGLLGPHRRREKLFNELMELSPEITYDFLDSIHGPAGLNIGAETPQEIAIAIVAEILTVSRRKEPILLKDKETGIHD
ncbi:XdhC family protein [Arenibacter sp. BSSL-BM3]|uniref:XdhC family protein n=1 Tax=Arenibacter arenosicollis TaxID=2762274 RepID=A0ABR7QM16_9FLAO|nr:XdhC/CoxI family protein [Arenibacter arenosicollis]MBC8768233.1 XdhC family protein [Arenibacter arenosicollis]